MKRKRELTTQEMIDILRKGERMKGDTLKKVADRLESLLEANKKLWSNSNA